MEAYCLTGVFVVDHQPNKGMVERVMLRSAWLSRSWAMVNVGVFFLVSTISALAELLFDIVKGTGCVYMPYALLKGVLVTTVPPETMSGEKSMDRSEPT
jgi:hypothetical protein